MKFLLHTQIGTEKIALDELEQKFKGKYSLDYTGFVPNKNGLIQLDWKEESSKYTFFNELNCIESAFLVIEYIGNLSPDLNILETYKKIDRKTFQEKLEKHFKDFYDLKFDDVKNVKFITRKKSPHKYLRSDLHESIEKFFRDKLKNIRVLSEKDSFQIWTTLIKNRLIIAIKLPKNNTEYKEPNIKPPIASCISLVSDINSSNSVWIPFSSTGIIASELLKNKSFKKLILSEENEVKIEIAKENLNKIENFRKNKGKISFKNEDFFSSKNFSDVVIAFPPVNKTNLVDKVFMKDFFDKVTGIREIKRLVILYPAIVENQNWLIYKNYQIRVNGIRMNLMEYQRQM